MLPNPIPIAPKAKRVGSRKRLLLAELLLLFVLVTGGLYAFFALLADKELKAAIAEADVLDPGGQLSELEAK
jgi:hypothetical protein